MTHLSSIQMRMRSVVVFLLSCVSVFVSGERDLPAKEISSTSATTTYHSTMVDDIKIFYREAGEHDAPTIILLHGFPSSSREFDTLIPLLATHYHILAPDLPGFGNSEAPSPNLYAYSFAHLSSTIVGFLDKIAPSKYSLYLHDYGGPIGFRVIKARPNRLESLVIQNANAYTEGLGEKWRAIAKFWNDPAANKDVVDAFLSYRAAEQRHTSGTSHIERYNPDVWNDEFAFLARPGEREIQTALLYDYRTNVAEYPEWHAWLRQHKPPTLIVWGRNDPSFIAAGAQAYRQDVPDAEIHLLDAGHFPLDEQVDEIAAVVLSFLQRYQRQDR